MTQLELFPEPFSLADREPSRPVVSLIPSEGIDLRSELRRYRRWLVDQALLRAGGNRARAAKLLGLEGKIVRPKSSVVRVQMQRAS